MTEEQVTKAILKWLTDNEWEIVCYDFPQSGSGKVLHPNDEVSEKNKDAIIPDIIAIKEAVSLFFENKNRFYFPDYQKQNLLKNSDMYSNDINELLKPFGIREKWFGIGLPLEKHKKKSKEASCLVDFIICVSDDKMVSIEYNPMNIFD